MRFIFATEESNYRHLYLYTVQLVTSHKSTASDGIATFSDIRHSKKILSFSFQVLYDQRFLVEYRLQVENGKC